MSAGTRPTIERMSWIAARLRRGHLLDAPLAAELFEVNVRTIRRDIDFMRDRLGYGIVWDSLRRTYFLAKAPKPAL